MPESKQLVPADAEPEGTLYLHLTASCKATKSPPIPHVSERVFYSHEFLLAAMKKKIKPILYEQKNVCQVRASDKILLLLGCEHNRSRSNLTWLRDERQDLHYLLSQLTLYKERNLVPQRNIIFHPPRFTREFLCQLKSIICPLICSLSRLGSVGSLS